MANPVFDRLDKQITKGDYAGFDRGSSATAASAGSGVQDSLNSQQLQDLYNQPSARPVQMRRVTLDDVVMKTLGLFTLLVIIAAVSWITTDNYATAHQGDTGLAMAVMLGAMLAGLGVGLVIAFKKTINVPLIVLYSALEGVVVGTISVVFNKMYPGIVSTAVIATLCTFAGMFLGWKLGLIKVTDKSRRIFGMALIGYLLFGLVNLVVALLGYGDGFGIGGNGPLGIAISALGVGLASYSLAIDFDSVDRAVKAELPEK
ncbi:MAG TPA: Bax inhibitor-1/YccA family protein, partial [Dermatophilaceae bacterium]